MASDETSRIQAKSDSLQEWINGAGLDHINELVDENDLEDRAEDPAQSKADSGRHTGAKEPIADPRSILDTLPLSVQFRVVRVHNATW